jgi:hypothetical protein
MTNTDESREQGVEFGSLRDELESEQYPMEKDALLEEYGSHELELEEEDRTLQEVLGPIGEATYDSADEVLQAVITNVDDEAIGRKNYSDRGDALNEEEREKESI